MPSQLNPADLTAISPGKSLQSISGDYLDAEDSLAVLPHPSPLRGEESIASLFSSTSASTQPVPLTNVISPNDPTLTLNTPRDFTTEIASPDAATALLRRTSSIKAATTWTKGVKKLANVKAMDDTDSKHDKDDTSAQELMYGNWVKATRVPRNKWIISADSSFRTYWDLSQLLVLSYVALLVPVRVCFNVEVEGPAFVVDLLVDAYFIIDVGVNFFSEAKIENGVEVIYVDSFKEIAKMYLRSWLVLDILACLPLEYITRVSEGRMACAFTSCAARDSDDRGGGNGGALKLLKLLRAFRLLKLVRLTRFKRILARYEDQLVYWQQVLVIFKVFGVVMLFSHWMGCFYGAVYEFTSDADEDGKGPTLLQKWASCFYWAVQTTTTVGYGDRTMDTVDGQLVAVLGMILGGVVFSWFLSNIFTLINPDPSYQQRQETMQYVVTYLKDNSVPVETASRVLSYFRKSSKFTFDEQRLLAELPVMLRTEIFDYLYSSSIRAAPVFKDQEENFVTELCLSVSPISFEENEMVYQEGDIGDCMFIIVSGKVSVLSEVNRKTILKGVLIEDEAMAKTVVSYDTAGSYFGEESILGARKRIDYVVAKSTTKLLSVPNVQLQALFDLYESAKDDLVRLYIAKLQKFEFSTTIVKKLMADIGLEHVLTDTGEIRQNYKAILRTNPFKLRRRSVMAESSEKMPNGDSKGEKQPGGAPMVPGKVPPLDVPGGGAEVAKYTESLEKLTHMIVMMQEQMDQMKHSHDKQFAELTAEIKRLKT